MPPTLPPSEEPPRLPDAPRRGAGIGNGFGLAEAAIGIVIGFLLAALVSGAYLQASGHPKATSSLGAELTSLGGLWVGLVCATIFASLAGRLVAGRPSAGVAPGAPAAAGPAGPAGPAGALGAGAAGAAGAAGGVEGRAAPTGRLATDFGFLLRPWPDLVLGGVVGVAAQFLLVPLLELPLAPFVHNLNQQIGKPAQQLTSHVQGPGLALLALFVCVGSPLVEELFFRGLLLRALVGSTAGFGRVLRPVVSIGVTSLLFALAHFEAIQFLGLAGFGAVLGFLAWRTGRLGPGIAAHAAFNAVAIISIALSR